MRIDEDNTYSFNFPDIITSLITGNDARSFLREYNRFVRMEFGDNENLKVSRTLGLKSGACLSS